MTTHMAATVSGGTRPLSSRQILHFYTSLVLNALLMTLAGPLMNVAIGRAAEPKLDLAAFWIAFTIMLFAESACLVIQQVTVALLGPRESLHSLAIAAAFTGLGAATVVLATAVTPFGAFVFHHLIPATPRTAELARSVLTLMAPIPVLIAFRGVANGVAVVEKRTTLLAAATMVRLLILSGVVAAVVGMGFGAGASGAAWALLIGVTAETSFIVAATIPHWRARLRRPSHGPGKVCYRDVVRVAAPLAVATLAWTFTRPVVNAILGHLPDSELAQASFGVVLPILLVSCSPLWALLDVSIVLPRNRADLGQVIRFATGISLTFALLIGVLTLTPLRFLLLRLGFNLSPELERAVAPALAFVGIEPFLVSARAVAQGVLMKARRTQALLLISPLKMVLLSAIGWVIVTRDPHINGALLAIGLVIGGDLFDATLYGLKARSVLSQGGVFLERQAPKGQAGSRTPLEDGIQSRRAA